MNEQEIFTFIKSIITDNEDITTFIPNEEIKVEHRLVEDLGLDSMNLMSIVYELQEKFESLDESGISHWKTLLDLIKAIQEL